MSTVARLAPHFFERGARVAKKILARWSLGKEDLLRDSGNSGHRVFLFAWAQQAAAHRLEDLLQPPNLLNDTIIDFSKDTCADRVLLGLSRLYYDVQYLPAEMQQELKRFIRDKRILLECNHAIRGTYYLKAIIPFVAPTTPAASLALYW